MSHLILVRHGQSQWNKLGKWTGWTDIDLDEDGIKEAKNAAKEISDIPIDIAFSSPLIRAKHTLQIILDENNWNLTPIHDDALREKNYGDYTGKNKWEIKEQVGDDEFKKIRRSWDYVLPNGESLKNVYERAVSFYEKEILPHLKEGKNVIVASHGNTVRALVKYFDNISDDKISEIEIATGELYVYEFNSEGKITHKEIRASHANTV